jgi:prepilin-type N-terminal cleavage/methylation domain-containing protein
MKHPTHSLRGFTLIELLVVISIIAILASLAIPAVTGALARGQMTQTLSNMKQMHLIAQTMALDATTTGDTNIGWPGDLPSKTWAGWVTNAVPGYIKTNDMAKLLSAPGITVPATATLSTLTPGAPGGTGRAVILYQVSETNDNSVVLFSSANFTNSASGGNQLSASALPYGDKGYIVFRKGGDGAVLQPRQIGSSFTNVIGGFAPVQN